jgi:hypothetical protein
LKMPRSLLRGSLLKSPERDRGEATRPAALVRRCCRGTHHPYPSREASARKLTFQADAEPCGLTLFGRDFI